MNAVKTGSGAKKAKTAKKAPGFDYIGSAVCFGAWWAFHPRAWAAEEWSKSGRLKIVKELRDETE